MASISAASGDPNSDDGWIHRTSHGAQRGGQSPREGGQNALAAWFEAIGTTLALRKTLWLMVVYHYKAAYRGQALGMFWSVANPLVMMAVLTLAFTQILKIPIENFPVFYLIGGVIWHFFTNGVSGATPSLGANVDLVKRTNLPRYFAPLKVVLANIINLGVETALLLSFHFLFPDAFHFGLSLLFLPVLLVILFFLTLGIGLATSALYVRFRDTQYVVNSVIMLAFWVTPILYSISMAPPWLANILWLNPMSGLIEGARSILMEDRIPELWTLAPGALGAMVTFALGSALFHRANLTVADYI